ncbi:hypothetical protein [Candidatus Electronema sp. JM]
MIRLDLAEPISKDGFSVRLHITLGAALSVSGKNVYDKTSANY